MGYDVVFRIDIHQVIADSFDISCQLQILRADIGGEIALVHALDVVFAHLGRQNIDRFFQLLSCLVITADCAGIDFDGDISKVVDQIIEFIDLFDDVFRERLTAFL